MKILIADDDDTFRALLSEVFEEAGYEVAPHGSGLAAWDYLESEAADIAVLDVNMPGMDGFELLSRIRADERHKAMPVLMLTIRSEVPDQVCGYEAGADDYLPKPFANEVLLARITTLGRRILGQGRPV
jgi:DNA-binding response OmpR family regulator